MGVCYIVMHKFIDINTNEEIPTISCVFESEKDALEYIGDNADEYYVEEHELYSERKHSDNQLNGMTRDQFFAKLDDLPRDHYIVKLAYKYSSEREYYISNELLEYEGDYTDSYVWVNDWDEGQQDVIVLGFAAVSDVDVVEGVSLLTEDDNLYYLKQNVTHWMPLPEPPESEVQDDEK